MYGSYYYDYSYFIFMLPALILSVWAQIKVQSTFRKFDQVRSARGLTGEQAALRVLQDNGITNVRVVHINGRLSDHFDPRDNVIRLSDAVFNNASVSAVGVAAHEAGHAVQYANGYKPMEIRGALVPVVQIGSSLSGLLILLGFLPWQYNNFFAYLGIRLFSLSVLFHVVTLPVELDASRRAIIALRSGNLLYDEELQGAKKVLTAAAMTYISAMLTSILSLIRLILIFNGRNRDD